MRGAPELLSFAQIERQRLWKLLRERLLQRLRIFKMYDANVVNVSRVVDYRFSVENRCIEAPQGIIGKRGAERQPARKPFIRKSVVEVAGEHLEVSYRA